MTADVEIRGVTHCFGSFTALHDTRLTIKAGQLLVLLGPSGCGKTTLLSLLGGFLTPTEGQILIGGADVTAIPPARRPTTTVFQDYALFPHMTLASNVAFGLRMRGVARGQRNTRAREMLSLVGLPGAGDRKPHQLSGGQRQRVALARALAVDPDVLLLDEPLGALDLKLRRQMQDELKSIQRRLGTTFVHVTHDQEEAMAIADEIVVMNRGRIMDAGPPREIYLRPRCRFSATFMGEANFIEGTHQGENGTGERVTTGFATLFLPRHGTEHNEIAKGDPVVLCFRPEHVRLEPPPASPALDLGPVRVVDAAFFGTHHRCHLHTEAHPEMSIVAHLSQASQPRDGQQLRAWVDPRHIVMLPQEGQ